MSKYNLSGATINATNLHIGDNNFHSSSQDFVDKNVNLKFTDTELELVKIIFENTNSDQERQTILESLKSIKNDVGTSEEKKNSILSFRPLLKKLSDIGEKTSVNITAKFLTDFAFNHNFSDIIHSIKEYIK